MTGNWMVFNTDEMFLDILKDFLPEKIFDSHAHLYRISDLNVKEYGYLNEGPEEAGYFSWRKHVGSITNGADLVGGSFFPMVSPDCDIGSSNQYLLKQLALTPNSRGSILVSPQTKIDQLDEYLSDPKIIGLKPYFYFSSKNPKNSSSITDFLPEPLWEYANSKKMIITLHIVKRKALADPDNLNVITGMCRKYPDVKLILAHAGRGFYPQNTIDGLEKIKDIDNIWFDTSSICESKALKAIIKCFGSRRLMWGTDFPDSQIRGKCVSVGDGFVWLDNTTVSWEDLAPLCRPVLFGIEAILAIKEAAEDLDLNRKDIQDIFYGNAADLFRI